MKENSVGTTAFHSLCFLFVLRRPNSKKSSDDQPRERRSESRRKQERNQTSKTRKKTERRGTKTAQAHFSLSPCFSVFLLGLARNDCLIWTICCSFVSQCLCFAADVSDVFVRSLCRVAILVCFGLRWARSLFSCCCFSWRT